jgi:hypothetical protein
MITEQQIKEIRQSLHDHVDAIFDSLLFDNVPPNEPDTFLEEINQPIPLASDKPGQEPAISDLEGLPPLNEPYERAAKIEELKTVLDLEETLETPLIETSKYHTLCALVINGYNGREVTKGDVNASLIRQNVAITEKQEEHLDFLRGIRSMLLSGEMELKTLLDQDGLFGEEKQVFETFAKENNLK